MFQDEEDEILAFMHGLGWPFRQINGQRILGPTKGAPTPGPGCEVMVKHLPFDIFENKLFPIFSQFGTIYSLRILVNFTGGTRGVAFIKYNSIESANLAVQKLNRWEITRTHTLIVIKSIDNVKLYVGGIPEKVTAEELLQRFHKEVDGAVGVKFGPKKATNRSPCCKFAFVEFRCHREAALARRYFRGTDTVWENTIKIDWAKPEIFQHEEYITNNKRIFIRNLAPFVSVRNIAQIILTMLSSEYLERVYIKSGYGFIHLTSHNAAEHLLKNLKGMVIGNLPIHMEWARPATNEEILLSNYKSVPYEIVKERRRRRQQKCPNDKL